MSSAAHETLSKWLQSAKHASLILFLSHKRLADLGYVGAGGHVVLQHKTPPRGVLSELQKHQNAVFIRRRARIEHLNGLLKSTWKFFSGRVQVRSLEMIRVVATAAILYEHIRMQQLPPRYPDDTADDVLIPGDQCECSFGRRHGRQDVT